MVWYNYKCNVVKIISNNFDITIKFTFCYNLEKMFVNALVDCNVENEFSDCGWSWILAENDFYTW